MSDSRGHSRFLSSSGAINHHLCQAPLPRLFAERDSSIPKPNKMEAKRVSHDAMSSTVVMDVQPDSTDGYSQLNEDILEECGNSITDSDSNSSLLHTVVVVDQAFGTLDRTKPTIPHADSDELVQSVKTLTTQIKALTDNTKQLALEGLSLRNELERVADQVDQAEKSDELTNLLAVEKLKKQLTFVPGSGSEPKRKGQGDRPSRSERDSAMGKSLLRLTYLFIHSMYFNCC